MFSLFPAAFAAAASSDSTTAVAGAEIESDNHQQFDSARFFIVHFFGGSKQPLVGNLSPAIFKLELGLYFSRVRDKYLHFLSNFQSQILNFKRNRTEISVRQKDF